MNYIVTDNELLFTYQSEFEAYLNYMDLIIYKCNFLTELIKENNQLNLTKFLTLKLFTTYKSTTIDIIYMDFNSLHFKNYTTNMNVNFSNFSDEELNIIDKKLILLRKYKKILDTNIVDQGVFINKDKPVCSHITTYSNDTTSDAISNLNLELDSIGYQEESEMITEESEICEKQTFNENEKNNDLQQQKEKIEKLLELKKQLERNKKKKEKLEEMLRRFEVDLEVYLRLKNSSEVPELFKYKYPVFEEMENKNISFTSNDAKKYYIKNFNRINKSIGSTIFTNVFNQREAEEDYEEISNNLNDSDENKITLSSEEIELSQAN
jgi:hypothetical protein